MIVLIKTSVDGILDVVGFGETVTKDELFYYLSGYHADEVAERLTEDLLNYSECEVGDLSNTRYSLHTI